MIRVHVASASSVGRKGLEALVRASDSLELAGTSTAWESLAPDIEDSHPDVVLAQTDRHYEDSPPEWLEILAGRARLQSPAIVLLAEGTHPPDLAGALRSGIGALLPLDATENEIIATIEAVASGLVVLHPIFLDLLPELQTPPDAPAVTMKSALTPREIEVLNLIAQGLGNKQIAAQLSISEHTVKFHIASIFNKLDASGRTEAVTLGIRAGLIML